MVRDKQVRLKLNTIQILDEVNWLRAREASRTKEVFAKLMKSARTIWTPDESVVFLARFYLKNRKK